MNELNQPIKICFTINQSKSVLLALVDVLWFLPSDGCDESSDSLGTSHSRYSDDADFSALGTAADDAVFSGVGRLSGTGVSSSSDTSSSCSFWCDAGASETFGAKPLSYLERDKIRKLYTKLQSQQGTDLGHIFPSHGSQICIPFYHTEVTDYFSHTLCKYKR